MFLVRRYERKALTRVTCRYPCRTLQMTCYCVVSRDGLRAALASPASLRRSPAIVSAPFASASALAIATQIDSEQEWDAAAEAPAASGQSPPASPVSGDSSTKPPAPAPAAGQGSLNMAPSAARSSSVAAGSTASVPRQNSLGTDDGLRSWESSYRPFSTPDSTSLGGNPEHTYVQ